MKILLERNFIFEKFIGLFPGQKINKNMHKATESFILYSRPPYLLTTVPQMEFIKSN